MNQKVHCAEEPTCRMTAERCIPPSCEQGAGRGIQRLRRMRITGARQERLAPQIRNALQYLQLSPDEREKSVMQSKKQRSISPMTAIHIRTNVLHVGGRWF